MLKELLAQLWTNVHSNEHCSICLTESLILSPEDSISFRNGLFVWCAILLEKASAVLEESRFSSFGGRVLKYPAAVIEDPKGIAAFLTILDEADDITQSWFSQPNSDVKNQNLLNELHCCLSEKSPVLWRTVSPLMKEVLSSSLTKESVSFLRQLFQLLSKLGIARDDMLEEHYHDYLLMEDLLESEILVQRAGSCRYNDIVRRVRNVLKPLIDDFVIDPRLSKHGPGAVSIPKVRGPIHKFMCMGSDTRIDYLLSKGDGSRIGDYSPLPLLAEDRTSRVIFVKKTWKKLRGISAEPVGLQYFQQAVFRSVDRSIRRTYLSHVIDLHDQTKSRRLALSSSRDGRLATIDLSSASDSVTLQLVKDIFGNSLLCRWLLATRSTHTLINNQRIRINKFAPMGSACCFPVECLIFAGVVLATAAEIGVRVSLRDIQIFGDDIICPAFIAPDVVENLILLGFTVNTDKSFLSGDFRESCGMDAWRGEDVIPLKLKDFSLNFNGFSPLSYEDHSRVISYCNALYHRGYFETRSFVLRKLSSLSIHCNGEKHPASKSLVYSINAPGTINSPSPTNYHLDRVPLRGLFRDGYKMVVYRPRYRKVPQHFERYADEVAYFMYLISQSSDTGVPVKYDLAYFRSLEQGSFDISKDMQMIPTIKTVDIQTEYFSV